MRDAVRLMVTAAIVAIIVFIGVAPSLGITLFPGIGDNIKVSEDAWVLNYPGYEDVAGRGQANWLWVDDRVPGDYLVYEGGHQYGGNAWSYLTFNLPTLPSNVTIADVKIAVYCYIFHSGYSGINSDRVQLYGTSPYDEMTISWGNKPSLGILLAENKIEEERYVLPYQPGVESRVLAYNNWLTFESTELKDNITGSLGTTVYFAIKPNLDNGNTGYYSAWYLRSRDLELQGGGDYTPYLEITYGVVFPPPPLPPEGFWQLFVILGLVAVGLIWYKRRM